MPKQVKVVQQVAPRQLAPSLSLAAQSGNPIFVNKKELQISRKGTYQLRYYLCQADQFC